MLNWLRCCAISQNQFKRIQKMNQQTRHLKIIPMIKDFIPISRNKTQYTCLFSMVKMNSIASMLLGILLFLSRDIYIMQAKVKVTPGKKQLPLILLNLLHKRSTLLFSRLILYESSPESVASIRHYDYECEGLVMLVGFFKKKHQAILMKAFNDIKIFPLQSKKRESNTDRNPWIGSTRRTNLNTTFACSNSNRLKVHSFHLAKQSRKMNNENSLTLANGKSSVDRLEGILNRLKEVNSTANLLNVDYKQDKYILNAEKSTFYLGNSRSRQVLQGSKANSIWIQPGLNQEKNYRSQMLDIKKSRREFILNKFAHIEANLSQMSQNRQPQYEDENEEIRKQANNFRYQLHTVQAKRMEKY